MSYFSGLDIGGTKIAGAVFDNEGHEIHRVVASTPHDYSELVTTCGDIVFKLDQACGSKSSLGVGAPFAVANMPYLFGKPLQQDLERTIHRPIKMANDANCLAMAEALDGAGAGYASVIGLILGTGVACGFVHQGKIVEGCNGLAGEVGHLPLPYYEASDGPLVACNCGQKGCIEKLTCGAALSRLHEMMVGTSMDPQTIAERAIARDASALKVLDQYYTVLAKAMVTILHSYDPEIIVVSGGLNSLPGLYQEVPKRWGHYALCKNPKTKLVAAKHGSMSGLRGAAWLWRMDEFKSG